MKVINNIKKFFRAEGINIINAYIYLNGILIPSNDKLQESILKKKKLEGYYHAISKNRGFIIELSKSELKKFKRRIGCYRNILFAFIPLIDEYYRYSELTKVIDRINATKKIEEIFGDILKEICILTKASIGAVTAYDKENNMIVAIGPGYKVKEEEINYFQFRLTEPSAAYKAMETKKTYWTNDAPKDPYFIKKFVDYFKVKRVCCTPVFINDELFGFIYLARFHGMPGFTKYEISHLDYISRHIGSLLKTLLTSKELLRKTDIFLNLEKANRAIVAEINLEETFKLIVNICIKLFDADAASLMVLDEKKTGFFIKAFAGLSEEYAQKQFIPYDKAIEFHNKEGYKPYYYFEDIIKFKFGDPQLIEKEKLKSVATAVLMKNKQPHGFLNIYYKRIKKLKDEDFEVLKLFALEASIAIRNAELYADKEGIIDSIIVMLSQLEAEKDFYTSSHSERVATLALKIAKEANINDEEELRVLKIASLLHDFGKIAIDKSILYKPSALNNEEWQEIKKHPIIAKNSIEKVKGLYKVAQCIYHHHERYDGKGYPLSLKGEEIPLCSRILCIADAIESMLSNRPYRKAMKLNEVMEELIKEKGKQFDPELVDISLKLLQQMDR